MSAPSPSLKGVGLPLRSAMKTEDERTPPPSGSVKAVQIAEPPETPLSLRPEEPHPIKQFSAGVGSVRMSGRPPLPASSSRTSLASVPSIEGMSGYISTASLSNAEIPEEEAVNHATQRPDAKRSGQPSSRSNAAEKLLAQVADWLQHEKSKVKLKKRSHHHHHHHHHHHKRRASPTSADAASGSTASPRPRAPDAGAVVGEGDSSKTDMSALQNIIGRARASSIDSDSSEISFDRLQRILDDGMAAMGLSSVPRMSPHALRPRRGSSGRRRTYSHGHSSRRSLARAYSSDTDYVDGEVVVPSCDAILDNTKTTSFSMGKAGMSSSSLLTPAAGSEKDGMASSGPVYDGIQDSTETPKRRKHSSSRQDAERAAWLQFKTDIITLAHTLRLKGWRRVPLNDPEAADTISVERLSGALTNAVYVVTPPSELVKSNTASTANSIANSTPQNEPTANSTASLSSRHSDRSSGKKSPEKLLLRVYGPQVEHLIDRDAELAVLRRLAKKKIGPRLLGTFTNGRFEQFFNASPLTPASMREPETSVLIAKRMRELHDGVDVLDSERFAGPNIWKNWDKWLGMVDRRMSYIDDLVRKGKGKSAGWRGQGFLCGVEWKILRKVVEDYKEVANRWYRDREWDVNKRLVFAHNDTQYGNILRIHSDDNKPARLTPQNAHKQLIVIDFEYAAANTPGLEFANHFTEWTYNYHDEHAPHACTAERYPDPEAQKRFIRAYVDHKPDFGGNGGSAFNTPVLKASAAPPTAASSSRPSAPATLQHAASSSSIVEFRLDESHSSQEKWKEEERQREEEKERVVSELMEETMLWRLANSAQWVAWGVVQAKIRGFVDEGEEEKGNGRNVGLTADSHETVKGGGDVNGDTSRDSGALEKESEEGKMNGGDVEGGKEEARAPEVVETGVTKGQTVEVETEWEPDYADDPPSPLEPEDAAAEEFDYLSYAHERSMFLLGDCIVRGVLKWDDIAEEVREQVKVVEY